VGPVAAEGPHGRVVEQGLEARAHPTTPAQGRAARGEPGQPQTLGTSPAGLWGAGAQACCGIVGVGDGGLGG